MLAGRAGLQPFGFFWIRLLVARRISPDERDSTDGAAFQPRRCDAFDDPDRRDFDDGAEIACGGAGVSRLPENCF